MPIRRSKYPKGWATVIRPRICTRDGWRCTSCALPDHAVGYRDAARRFVPLAGSEEYVFQARNVTTPHYDQVRAHFGVNREGLTPEVDFYRLYKEDIGIREFVFAGRRYVPDGDEVNYVAHQEAADYARVGADWFRWVRQLKAGGDVVETLDVWKVGEIQRDYKNYSRFLDEVPKFTGFTVEPNWNGEYQCNLAGNLNLVTPLAHQPKPGAITHTLAFLKHLFGGAGRPGRT